MKQQRLLPRIPAATYRLQFSGSFGFRDARNIAAYLNELGVTDIYASPYLKAKKGSIHGYDIVDHNALNPEIGTEEEYDEYAGELGKYGMSQILDIVPNHMYIESSENTLWMDVLENGPSSVNAHFFDIDWDPVKKELRNKVLLPILGDQYGKVLDKQELRLSFEEGSFSIHYYDHKFPVVPKTYITLLEHGVQYLEERLEAEHPDLVELLSIITALNHLPPYTAMSHEKVTERHREKEIIKRRLWTLYIGSPIIKEYIDERVRLFNGTTGDPRTFDLLDELLDMQVYRLSYWRVATEEINYRRFFDINHLAAIRTEDPGVFRYTHKLVMKLIGQKKVTGLRVDHPDGLYDPSEYFHRLQLSCFSQLRPRRRGAAVETVSPPSFPDLDRETIRLYNESFPSVSGDKPFYIIGEKILLRGERMPEEWPIFSTTGYVFLNSVNGIFIETRNARAFDNVYKKFTRLNLSYQDVVYEKKKLIMEVAMSGEVNTLGHYLNRISEKDRHTRDFTLNSLTHAILEVIAYFPVYRTYINSYDVTERDRQYIELAVSKAKRKNPAISGSIFDFLRDVLLVKFPESISEDDQKEWLDFVMRFQQITGPVMAKGLEDTAFYVYNRLVSLNEVGGTPERFGTPLETFHGQNIERTKSWPHALIATSTHDTKRSEDVRSRINVLSEIPAEWRSNLALWRRLNRKKRLLVDGQFAPDRNEEYLFYQSVVGAWPVGETDKAGYAVFKERIRGYMLKAVREAKVNTSWVNPNAIYEDAVMIFVDSVLGSSATENQFLKEFVPFQRKISHFGMFNSLSQTLLKITCPGVPDFYQGSEIWDFSLVDPDNRRPVDYGLRIEMLRRLKEREGSEAGHALSRELTLNKDTGEIKLYVTYKALACRKTYRKLFEEGEYMPLETAGEAADHICSFARRLGNREVVVIVPRFLIRLVPEEKRLPFGTEVWGDSHVIVPFTEEGGRYRNVFTSETISVGRKNGALCLHASEVFANSPVALLEKT